MRQLLLLPDPRPLVERLGREFFQASPECAGVYIMRDSAKAILYVGKAKNIRKRLNSYRVANPERMPRRHLRMLRRVAMIEFERCADEAAALARESELLLQLRPPFNRTGTWSAPKRFLLWRAEADSLCLRVTEKPGQGWFCHGPIGSGKARMLLESLLRLLWFPFNPGLRVAEAPTGWFRPGHHQGTGKLKAPSELSTEACKEIDELLCGACERFFSWLQGRAGDSLGSFEQRLVEAELELFPGTARVEQGSVRQLTIDKAT